MLKFSRCDLVLVATCPRAQHEGTCLVHDALHRPPRVKHPENITQGLVRGKFTSCWAPMPQRLETGWISSRLIQIGVCTLEVSFWLSLLGSALGGVGEGPVVWGAESRNRLRFRHPGPSDQRRAGGCGAGPRSVVGLTGEVGVCCFVRIVL